MYEDDPALELAIEKGMTYKVINWVVHAALPDISSVIISALNTVMQVGGGESWVQNLLKITTEAGKYTNKNPDWRAVSKTVIRTLPPRAGDVPDMAAYVQVWGGACRQASLSGSCLRCCTNTCLPIASSLARF